MQLYPLVTKEVPKLASVAPLCNNECCNHEVQRLLVAYDKETIDTR